MTGFSAPSRILGPLALVGLVAACGGRETPIRGTSQAVHPSPSALAQGATYIPATEPTATYAPTYTSTTNDGSQPIID